MTHAYATVNAASALAASAYTWSTAATTDRDALNDGRMSKVCTSGSTASTIDLTIDFGTATGLMGFALLSHTIGTSYLTRGVTCEVSGADDAAQTVNAVTAKAATTINVTEPNHRDAVLTFPLVTKRYWRLRFAHTGTVAIVLGEVLALDGITSLTRRKVYGWGESEKYYANIAESRTGETHATFLAGPRRTRKLPFVDLSASEKAEVMAMFRATKGGVTPLLWIEDYNSTASAATASEQECIWGRVQQSLGWTEGDFSLYGPEALELTSLGRVVGE